MRSAIKRQINCTNNKRFKVLLVIFILSFSFCIFHIIIKFRDNKLNSDIRNELNNLSENLEGNNSNQNEINKIEKLNELKQINSEIIGLLEIEGTNINYPVMQTSNNDYYITHNYKKEYSKDGGLFLDKEYDFNIPSTNLLIYGHNNIGSSEMFVDLLKYKDEDFYNKHKILNFTTSSEDAKFEIIAVFKSRVYYQHEQDVFRYYYFINAKNQYEFDDYVSNAKKSSIYNIEETAKFGDQLLTLSTCEYSQKDGRFVVVARKI